MSKDLQNAINIGVKEISFISVKNLLLVLL